MIDIRLVQADGTKKEVTADPGATLMQVGVAHGVDGIVGECGGTATCGTCHVYIEAARTRSDRAVGFDRVVFAPGGQPRELSVPGADLPGVQPLHSLAQGQLLRATLRRGLRVVLIGAGSVGLEVAHAVRGLGGEATIVETASRVMGRVASTDVSAIAPAEARSQGIDVRLGTGVEAILGNDRVRAVALTTGDEIPADLVLVCIGLAPRDQPAREAGLATDRGVLVDGHCLTSHRVAFAIGDCVKPRHVTGHVESAGSMENATHHAHLVADRITGTPQGGPRVPWVWSSQGGLHYHRVGVPRDGDDLLMRGSGSAFARLHFRDGQLVGAECMNRVRDANAIRRLLSRRLQPALAGLADPTTAIRPAAEPPVEEGQAS